MPNHILKGVEGFKKKADMFYVHPDSIQIVPGWNGRTDFSDLEDLMPSIKEVGIYQPLIVKKNTESKLELVAGERRLRSVLELNKNGCQITSVPVIVRSSRTNEIDLYIESVTENTGKPLAPIEEATSFKRLIAWGLSRQEIATKCGRSLSHVRNRIELSGATPAVKKAVTEKEITTGAAQKIVKESHGSVETQEKKLEEVKAEPKKKVEPEPEPEKQPEKKKVSKATKVRHLEYELKLVLFKLIKESNRLDCDHGLDLYLEQFKDLLFDEEDQFQVEYSACKGKI